MSTRKQTTYKLPPQALASRTLSINAKRELMANNNPIIVEEWRKINKKKQTDIPSIRYWFTIGISTKSVTLPVTLPVPAVQVIVVFVVPPPIQKPDLIPPPIQKPDLIPPPIQKPDLIPENLIPESLKPGYLKGTYEEWFHKYLLKTEYFKGPLKYSVFT